MKLALKVAKLFKGAFPARSKVQGHVHGSFRSINFIMMNKVAAEATLSQHGKIYVLIK